MKPASRGLMWSCAWCGFDAERWRAEFLAQWPVGSAAWLSYFQRITAGPAFTPAQALAAV